MTNCNRNLLNRRYWSMALGVALFGSLGAITPLHFLPTDTDSAQAHLIAQNISWGDVWRLLGKKRRGGSRGEFCPISPNTPRMAEQVWSLHPLFIWRGSAARIEVRVKGSKQVLWRQTWKPTQPTRDYMTIQYGGPALQPGQTYEWQLFRTPAGDSALNPPIPFQTIGNPQRRQIQAQLLLLVSQSNPNGATTEAVALQRAHYFAQQELWADALQEVFSVHQPTAELKQIMEEVPVELCKASSS